MGRLVEEVVLLPVGHRESVASAPLMMQRRGLAPGMVVLPLWVQRAQLVVQHDPFCASVLVYPLQMVLMLQYCDLGVG